MAWPPTLPELKADMSIAVEDMRDDAGLQRRLDAAVAFVEDVRASSYSFDGDELSDLPTPPQSLELGTLMLARRWWERRKSPDAIIEMNELGSARVPSFDPDIDRLLGIGRYRGPVFA